MTYSSPVSIKDPSTRFAFGKNWAAFLENLTEDKIREAEKSLKKSLGVDTLEEKLFLDIGSGSGLFSLAAYCLGARVISFDYDGDSVACTKHLQNTFGDEER
jgi:2-polyprenyl-6-hydroxyphenyl methylase/3-demethylubiquinone-9 3-methyltransferase